MPVARFVNDTAVINVNGKTETASVGVKSGSVSGRVGVSTYPQGQDHDKLNNRGLPDQHPMSAITGLEEDLTDLQDQIDSLNAKELVGGSNISLVTEGNQTIINTATYIYEQAVASETWTINHNLNKFPSVVIVDSTGNVFYPAVEYNNNPNQCIVTMNGATTGKAYLN